MGNYEIQHRIILYGQPTETTCWSAAVTMLLGTNQSIGSGSASTDSKGGLEPDENNVANFARSHGLKIYYPQSWSAGGLVDLIKRGPFALFGKMRTLHVVVVGGLRTDGTENGTVLKIYDPWPPMAGAIIDINYSQLMQKYAMATRFVLQK